MSKFTYSIEKELVTLSSTAKGWKKQLNLVSWNGLPPKYDLREWDGTHSHMGKGVTLSEVELKTLYLTLKGIFEGETESENIDLNFSEKIMYWEQHVPLFVHELKNCVEYMKTSGLTQEQIKAVFLSEINEGIEGNILNEVESLDSIYHLVFEEFKEILRMGRVDPIKTLLSTMGYSVPEEMHNDKVTIEGLLICRGKNALAMGEYKDGGVLVHQGSTCNIEEARTAGSGVINMRAQLLDNGVLDQQENIYVFTSNYFFSSPSAAAAAVLGRRANGWTEWKAEDGRTLNELERNTI
ncbi:PC4/YdbC family ssDNA-binding protein [Bacillus mycoides]|uniref:PC4/YdbC family ssDNA-binding protein n=1 Tax=Bacillus mycoides TaxID=1405 RepID=UPI0008728ED3|nr:hypothetical protein BWGOE2_32850 [Bacillus mycoides]OFD49631.1 hypothetical protein BWGOE1_09150 [Bacillus mycoides]